MGIANHLIENFKKLSYDDNKNFIKESKLEIFVNKNNISGDVSKKKYNICDKNINVYNVKVDIKSFSRGDTISFKIGDNIVFEFYDSDENTYMYISEDKNNYYTFIGYDTDYNWANSKFINEDYSYAFTGDVEKNKFEYMLVNNPKDFLEYEIDHVINIWIVIVNKESIINPEKMYNNISLKLL